MKFSTGLRTAMLNASGLKEQLDGGFIRVYGGVPAPASADDAIPGGATLIVTISDDGAGGGLTLDTPVGGVIYKDPSQVWKGTNATTMQATFFRHVAAGDTGNSSTTAPRIQGTCGVAAADMLMPNTTLVNGEEHVLAQYAQALPTL